MHRHRYSDGGDGCTEAAGAVAAAVSNLKRGGGDSAGQKINHAENRETRAGFGMIAFSFYFCAFNLCTVGTGEIILL
jgi:hypothetical protein